MAEKRKKPIQGEHDKLVSKIAKKRFSYKDGTVTHTNPNGEKNYAVDSEYPDIVAIKNKSVIALGEVETEETVNEDEAKQWTSYATLSTHFYLYVPKSKISDVKTLIKNKKIGVKGLRSFEYVDSKLVIKNVEI